MNVVLLVVDSLRYDVACGENSAAPFLKSFHHEALRYDRAYATSNWTLPSHMSMFTGLLPSEHGANFNTMAYCAPRRTVAEILALRGFETTCITRNSVFDGSIDGPVRGFNHNESPMAELNWLSPLGLGMALAKPRVRRMAEKAGYFSLWQKGDRAFVKRLLRMGMPADDLALTSVLNEMRFGRDCHTPYFIFANLFDVHNPYGAHPAPTSRAAIEEIVACQKVLPRVIQHDHLEPGFSVPEGRRKILWERYRRAVTELDAKLCAFYGEAQVSGLLDDTLLIITSDHGEGFGEHGLWGHDAGLYDTHLHVPLWVRGPHTPPGTSDFVTSTRDIDTCILNTALGTRIDPSSPIALAEHYPYRTDAGVKPEHRTPTAAAMFGDWKVVQSADRCELFHRAYDPFEVDPFPYDVERAEKLMRGYASRERAADVASHLAGFARARGRRRFPPRRVRALEVEEQHGAGRG